MSNDYNPERVEHVYTFVIPARQKPQRLDTFITNSIEHATRTRVQKAIERGAVTVNQKPTKANYSIRPGDVIAVVVHKQPPMLLTPQPIPLDILFEDDYLIVLNKPAGILVHPGLGNRGGTLVNAILWHCGQREPIDVLQRRETRPDKLMNLDMDDNNEQSDFDEADDEELHATTLMPDPEILNDNTTMRPGIVHRLDKETTGVMVVAKDYRTTLGLSTQFAQRTVEREYVALAWGVIQPDELTIEGNIDRSTRDRKLFAVHERTGKFAVTDVRVIERYDYATLITCRLRTGRTHQIRVHLQWKQHPLVGDPDYGGREKAVQGLHHIFRRRAQDTLATLSRQALHARLLGFDHPVTGEHLRFTSPVPSDVLQAVQSVRPPDAGELPPCLC